MGLLLAALTLSLLASCRDRAQTQASVETLEAPPPFGRPTFVVRELHAGDPLKVVAYGDIRFTDPHNTDATDPRMRQFLVNAVAREHADAVLLTGDIPYISSDKADWEVYRRETASWQSEHLRLYPTIGNHEIVETRSPGLGNYFAYFPELANHTMYSVQMGSVFLIVLDTTKRVMAPSPAQAWLDDQLAHLPQGTRFVFLLLHHPLIADVQSQFIANIPGADHSALRRHLEGLAPTLKAKMVVLAGHLHNYERYEQAGITHLISGGGGAQPYPVVVRSPGDQYHGGGFPNFHYLVFEIHGASVAVSMYQVVDPDAVTPVVEVKDRFTLRAP